MIMEVKEEIAISNRRIDCALRRPWIVRKKIQEKGALEMGLRKINEGPFAPNHYFMFVHFQKSLFLQS